MLLRRWAGRPARSLPLTLLVLSTVGSLFCAASGDSGSIIGDEGASENTSITLGFSGHHSGHGEDFQTCAELTKEDREELDYEEHFMKEVFEGVGEMVICGAAGLMGTLLLISLMEKCHVHWIPESLVVMAMGLVLGVSIDLLIWANYFKDFDIRTVIGEINAPLLNLVFLPIIIFESGWSLRVKDFGAQLEYILLFAVVGSGIAMLIVAALIKATSPIHGIDNWRTAGVYASLIAATDPVATLATYSSLKVDPFLNIMVFGESTINDAVAITVFNILNSDTIFEKPCMGEIPVFGEHYWRFFGNVLSGIGRTLFGSILFGTVMACLFTLAIRVCDMRHSHTMETLFITASCYFVFALAEHIHLSGIISVLFCSIMMGIYATGHLSRKGHVLTSFFLKQLSSLADTAIFLLVGVDSVLVITREGTLVFGSMVMLFCLFARAVVTFPLGSLANCLKRTQGKARNATEDQWLLLSWKHLFMMWHAGLRGGISLMLTLELGEWVDLQNGKGTRQLLLNVTLIIIVFFLLIFGGTTEASLKCMGIPTGVKAGENYLWDKMSLQSIRWYHFLNTHIFHPILVGADEADDDPTCEDTWQMRLGTQDRQSTMAWRERRLSQHAVEEESDDEEDVFSSDDATE